MRVLEREGYSFVSEEKEKGALSGNRLKLTNRPRIHERKSNASGPGRRVKVQKTPPPYSLLLISVRCFHTPNLPTLVVNLSHIFNYFDHSVLRDPKANETVGGGKNGRTKKRKGRPGGDRGRTKFFVCRAKIQIWWVK